MVDAQSLFPVMDELNVLLVAGRLKPASLISIDPQNPAFADKIITSEEVRDSQKYKVNKVSPEVVVEAINLFAMLALKYRGSQNEWINESWDSTGKRNSGVINKGYTFYIGSDSLSLDHLVTAKDDKELGLALGFPESAVTSFREVIDGDRRDGSDVPISMAKAKMAGVEIPTWLAYISFVPEQLDFVNKNVCPSTKRLGRRYRDFVQKHEPELAKRVEEQFFARLLPTSWEREEDGGYCLNFNGY